MDLMFILFLEAGTTERHRDVCKDLSAEARSAKADA
jgi:hypothetical protein